ncbi:MAG TPA: histidine kinase [Steroidobacteraceae bacterium]|nr:histidine kinase [Steroidobacteraceae bacterium]
MSKNRNYWLLQLGGWGALAAAQWYAATFYLKLEPLRVAVEVVVLNGAAVLLTHLLRAYMRAKRWDTLRAGPLAPRIGVASLIVGVPLGVLNHFLSISALREPSEELNGFEVSTPWDLAHEGFNWTLTIVLWCVVYFVILSGRRRREAELRQSELARALHAAELRALKSQLNPHFLFNALNTVRALIAIDPARAQKAVTQLSRTLRYTLSPDQEDQLVSLDQELEIVDDYLALESLRLDERLRIERNISEDARAVRIPVMLLQTVVENAIKHGIAQLKDGGVLHIDARIEKPGLILEIRNPRPVSVPPATGKGEGVGLRNSAERLRLLFGSAAQLHLDLDEPGGALMRIVIPSKSIAELA